MMKTILITGATDGIGLQAARQFVSHGHRLLVHGRNAAKLQQTRSQLEALNDKAEVRDYCCDLSDLQAVVEMAQQLLADQKQIDVIINNAGVLKTPDTRTGDNLDIRFVVNTLAPYLLTRLLLPACPSSGRVINLSSAAQAPVDRQAMRQFQPMSDMDAYSQSKLAITMWSAALADELGETGPMVISVNPGSLLATNMVKEGFGIEGKDVTIGSDILVRLALSSEADIVTGSYYDNDNDRFADPHVDALDATNNRALMQAIGDQLSALDLL